MRLSYVLGILFLLSSRILTARDQVQITIDSPQFHRMVVATVKVSPSLGQADKILSSIQNRLDNFLVLSGFFSVLAPHAHPNMIADAKKKVSPFEKMTEFRALGVQVLIALRVEYEQTKPILYLEAKDVATNLFISRRQVSFLDPGEVSSILKRFADDILQAFTKGGPGIFSTQIVFVGQEHKNSPKQVYLSDMDGQNRKQLTFTKEANLAPAWSPDGKSLLFTSYRYGKADMFSLDLGTTKVQAISTLAGINSGGVYSIDQSWIVFTGSVDGRSDLYIKKPDQKSKRYPLLSGHGLDVDPAFSPDGKFLAYVSGKYSNPHIFLATLQGGRKDEPIRVIHEERLTYAGWYNATPAWSPDSKKITFAGYDKEVGCFDLFLMNKDGTNLERLTLSSGDNNSPSFSPNGHLIIFHSNRVANSTKKGRSQLYLMNHDGSQQRLIDTGLYSAETPKWGAYKTESFSISQQFKKASGL